MTAYNFVNHLVQIIIKFELLTKDCMCIIKIIYCFFLIIIVKRMPNLLN